MLKIGKKLRKKAEQLGFLSCYKTTLYAGANQIRRSEDIMMGTYIPDSADEIWRYLKSMDSSSESGKSKPSRKKILYYLAPDLGTYVEVEARVSGYVAIKAINHVIKVDIYCDNDIIINGIAQAINSIFEGGILNKIDWKKIEKVFHINREKEISVWKTVLQ